MAKNMGKSHSWVWILSCVIRIYDENATTVSQ